MVRSGTKGSSTNTSRTKKEKPVKEKIVQELTPFTVLFDMNRGRIYSKEDVIKSGLSSYLLLHFIKTHPILLNVASYLNQNWRMPIYDMYLFVFLTFKRYKITDVRWVKSDKLQKPEDISLIQKYYNVSYKVASRYLDALSKEELEFIKDYYSTGGVKK